MGSLRDIAPGMALKISFLILPVVLLLWILSGISKLIELEATWWIFVFLIACSLLFDTYAFIKTIVATKKGQIVQSIILCLLALVLASVSSAMLYGAIIGIAIGRHPRP